VEPRPLTEQALRERRGVKWHHYDEDVLPAWVADMDFPVADVVQEAILAIVERRDYGYASRAGSARVQEAFAERMAGRFGWEVDPEAVLPVSDLVQGITAAIVAFSGPGDGVALQTPIYPPFLSTIDATGRRRVPAPLRDDGSRFVLDEQALLDSVDDRTRILLVCNPHNPTGRVLERAELEALGKLAVERDLVLVSDEIHCDLVYSGHRHLPLASLAPEYAERTLTLNSATKGFNIAGLRCGVMHFGSPGLLERFRGAIPERVLGGVDIIGHDATVAAWRHAQPWLDQVMVQLQTNRDRVAAWAADRSPRIHHHPPEATYLAWFDCRDHGLEAPPQQFLLERARVGLNPGSDFGPGGETCVRLNFATSPEILGRVLNRMERALEGR
jgi:cystathionine beta-lyase